MAGSILFRLTLRQGDNYRGLLHLKRKPLALA